MNTSVNTNINFGTNSSNTNTNSSIGSTPNNSSPTYQNTYTSNNNVQTESMDLSFATEQVATESKSILDSIGDFFSDVREGLKNTGAAIVDGAKTVANWAITGIKDLGSSISEACSNLASNVSSILGSALSWAKDTYISLQATSAVIGTTVVSGIADIGEKIVDGLTWTGGKLVEGGSWLVGKVAGWFSDDAEEAVMEWREQAKTDVKEFIATDWVGEANDWFYQDTALGRYINENSYLKYDSEAMQKLRGATETVGKLVLATAASCLPMGAVAVPLLLGFSSGVGERSEKLYQENMDTTGAQELGIFVSGLGEAANWYAQGQLGKGALKVIGNLKNAGLKVTGAQLEKSFTSGVKSLVGKIKTDGLGKTTKDAISALGKLIKGSAKNSHLASLKAGDNLADSMGIIGDNVSDWLIGEEELNLKTAASAGGELLAAWGLNMFFDGTSNYLEGLAKQGDTVVKNADIFSADDTASLGSKFDDFTTTLNTDYGVDQAVCKRLTYNKRINNDWLTNPDDFRKFFVEKFPDMSSSEIDKTMKIFLENENINNNCKAVIIEYLQKTQPDYQSAFETYSNSFTMVKKEGYDNIIKKYVNAGMSESDAVYLLSHIDTTGVCSYAAQANGIVATFINDPTLFKEKFGYDLFINIDGKQVLNSGELLSDLYVYANLDTNGGKLFTFKDGNLTYLTKDFSQQTYLSGGLYTRDDIIDGFLKSKSSTFGYSDSIQIFSYDKTLIPKGVESSTAYKVDDIKKIFEDVLVGDNNVQLGLYQTPHNAFTFYNMDGSVYITTNSWNEGSGHAVFVTGKTDDGILVSSWGEKLLIKYEDFIDNRYNISWGEITGVTPTTVSDIIPTSSTTKIITEGVGDGASVGEYKNVTPFTPTKDAETYYGIPSKSTYTAHFVDDNGIAHQKTYYLSGNITEGQATGVIKHIAQASDESFAQVYKKDDYKKLLEEAKNNATDEEIIKLLNERLDLVNKDTSKLYKDIDKNYVRIPTGQSTEELQKQMKINDAIGIERLEQLESLEITSDKLQTLLKRSGLTEQYDAIMGSNASYEQKMEQLHFLASEGAAKIYAKTLDDYAKGNFEEYMGVPIYIDPKVDEKPYYIEILTRPVNEKKGENIGNPVEAIKHMLHKDRPQTIPKAAANQGKKTINYVLSTKMGNLLQEQMLTGTISTDEICESLSKLAIDDVTLPEGAQYIKSEKYRNYAIEEINKIVSSDSTLKKIQDGIEELSE